MRKPSARDSMYRKRVFDADIIELCVRWYITYRLSYRDLVEMMAERGVQVAHSTILRWVTRYVPEFVQRWSRFSKAVGTSCRLDETCISIKAKWHYRYRAIKRRCASMAGFKSFANAAITIAGIELAHRIRKGQFWFGRGRRRRGWSRKAEWAMALA